MSVDKWVAVAYEDNKYFVGQVEKINNDRAQVNFLTKSANNDFFYWPQVPDKDEVEAKVIFCHDVKVTKEGRKYKVLNLKDTVSLYEGFSKKYF